METEHLLTHCGVGNVKNSNQNNVTETSKETNNGPLFAQVTANSTIGDVKGDGNVCHSLNVDGAFDASDSDENDGEPKGQNLGKTSATGNGNDNFEGVYIKEEEMEGNEEDWTDPMDHVEVEMPPLFSLMTPAASIARIQRTNLPQTPKRCNDCIHEDKWFNSKDGLLAHDVFYHGKPYCATCDSFFSAEGELAYHTSILHLRFTCDQCSECFEGKDNYRFHYLHAHKILHCLLCAYSFTAENISAHMIQGHRIEKWADQSLNQIIDPEFSIIFDVSKFSMKCQLCRKRFPRDKIYNHIRYFHHTSTHQAIDLLLSVNFRLATEECEEYDMPLLPLPQFIEAPPPPLFIDFEGRSAHNLIPLSVTYKCPVQDCPTQNELRQDGGVHLLMDHSMSHCYICGGFFPDRFRLFEHIESLHQNDEQVTCNECFGKKATFSSNYTLMLHLKNLHSTHCCCFCDNISFKSASDFQNHMVQYHEMWHDQAEAPETFFDIFLNSVFIRRNGGKMECHLCSATSSVDLSDISDNDNLRRHVSKFHGIRHLGKFMSMYDPSGETFAVKNFEEDNCSKDTPSNSYDNSVPAKPSREEHHRTNYRDSDHNDSSAVENVVSDVATESVVCEVDENMLFDDSDDDDDDTNDASAAAAADADENGKNEDNSETKPGGFRCELCTTTTVTKSSMRRHCLRSHDLPLGYFRKDICHSCSHCDAMFWSVSEKVQHVAQAHSSIEESLAKCYVCFHISPNKPALRRHFKRMHPDEKLFENVSFKCPTCGELFKMQKDLQKHTKENHQAAPAPTHPCRLCDKKFVKFYSWKKHQEVHQQSQEGYSCEHCDATFDCKRKLTWHLKQHTAQLYGKEAKLNFKCKLCEMKFYDRDEREVHYKQVHPNEPMYPCLECGAMFNTKSARWSHGFIHKAEDTFKCEHCSKTFSRSDTYREHLLIHTGPRYRCTHCPKEFVQRSNLRRHIRVHLGIKPYNCEYCHLSFTDKGACNSHMKIHTGDHKEKCKYCGQEFSKGQKLRYHMRIHTGDGLLTCDVCSKVFTNSYSLKTHIKRVHAKVQDQLPCHYCDQPGGYIGTSRKTLKRHMERTHKDAPLQCKMCLLTFKSHIEVNTHMTIIHFNFGPGGEPKDEANVGYQCRHCENVIYPGLSDMKRHLEEVHDIKTGLSMHYLNKYVNESETNFTTPDMITDQPNSSPGSDGISSSHKIKEQHPCYFCAQPGGYIGPSRKSLKRHLDKHHTEEPLQCRMCTSTFSSHVKVNTHMKNVHFIFDMGADHHLDDDDEDNVGYQCRHCEDARYTELLDMEQHLVEVHDIKTDLSMHYLNKYIGEREDNFNDDPSSPPESDLWVPSSSSRKRKNSDSEDSPIAKTKPNRRKTSDPKKIKRSSALPAGDEQTNNDFQFAASTDHPSTSMDSYEGSNDMQIKVEPFL